MTAALAPRYTVAMRKLPASSAVRLVSLGVVVLVAVASQGCAKSEIGSTKKDMAGAGHDLAGGPGDQGTIGDMPTPSPVDLAVPGKDAAAPGPCNVVTQSGCADGQKCVYTDPAAGAVMTTCATDGQELAGTRCNDGTNGDCIGANLCTIEDDAPAVNICRTWCDDDTDCTALASVGPENRAWCEIPLTGFPSKLCTQPCNPVPGAGASGCDAMLGCRYFTVTRGTVKSEATNCAEVGAKVLGDDCANTNECGGSLICVSVNMGTAKCRAVCRNQANGADMKPNDCQAAETCQGLNGLTDPFFGVCLPN